MADMNTKALSTTINPRIFRTRFNPIRNLRPDTLSRALDEFDAGRLGTAVRMFESILRRDDTICGLNLKRKKSISRLECEIVVKEDSQVFGAYSHMGGKIVAFAIVNGSKEEVAKDVCMHVAAMNPKYLSKEFVDQAYLESETDIIRQEALNENRQAAKPKPEAIIEKMVEGRVNKMLKEICLVDQPFVKNPDETVGQFVKNQGCEIVLYVRLGVGEGIEKRKDDFVAEVMAAVNKSS